MGILNRMAQVGTDPIAQAVNVYSTLSGVQSKKEEMDLRRKQDAREAEAHRLDMADKRGAIDFKRKERQRTEAEWQREDEVFSLKKSLVALDSDQELSPEQLGEVLTARSLLNVEQQEPLENVIGAHHAVGKFFGQDLPAMNLDRQTVIRRGPQTEQLFQAMERLSASRAGDVHTYQALDLDLGQAVEKTGTPAQADTLYYDPKTDSVALAMSVVDSETGKPLLNADGSPMSAPATEGKSSAPDAQIRWVPRRAMVEASRLGIERNQKVVARLEQMDPVGRRKVILSHLSALGDTAAATELNNLKQVERYSQWAKEQLAQDGLDDLTRRELEGIVAAVESGVTSVDQIKAMTDITLKNARENRGIEVAGKAKEAEARAQWNGLEGPKQRAMTARQEGADKAAGARNAADNDRAVEVAERAYGKRKDPELEMVRKDYDSARREIGDIETKMLGVFQSDPTNIGKTPPMSYFHANPAWRRAKAEFDEAKARFKRLVAQREEAEKPFDPRVTYGGHEVRKPEPPPSQIEQGLGKPASALSFEPDPADFMR